MCSIKKLFFSLCFTIIGLFAVAQTDSIIQPESTRTIKPKEIVRLLKRVISKADSVKKETAIVIRDSTIKPILDSSRLKDSLLLAQKKVDSIRLDSVRKRLIMAANAKDTSTYSSIFGGTFIPISLHAIALLEKERNPEGKEFLFYVLVALVTLVAFTKLIFPKYVANMFSLFLQTSYRQKQAIEQLTNNTISSVLLNLVFIVCMAVYITLVFENKGLLHISFWLLLLYSLGAIASIYLFKFIFLTFIGWVFNVKEAMESYVFVVFLSNKIIAIILLPFVFLIAFNSGVIASICLLISYGLIILLLLYRFFVVISSIRSDLKVNALHFFLYLCGVEILPLLLIYKAVSNLITTSI